MWVVTREINAYDQDGSYLVTVYKDKPTLGQLSILLPNRTADFYDHLLAGDGHKSLLCEDEWFTLSELGCGEVY